MELEEFTELYKRIQTEPSILLLGQNYLSIGGNADPVWKELTTKYYPDLPLRCSQCDYPALWEQVVHSQKDAESLTAQIAEASGNVKVNIDALSAVLGLRWSLLYTSAIDSTDAMTRIRGGLTPVPANEKKGQRRYLNKERHYQVDLCRTGDAGAVVPPLDTRPSKARFDDQIKRKIGWIADEYLTYYGVLVIDGLNPDCDWLDDDTLFGKLYELPPNSVYWFGCPSQIGEQAEALVRDGILVTDRQGLYENMAHFAPELLRPETEEENVFHDDLLYVPLTLRLDSQQKRENTIYISRAAINDINGDTLCVLTDEILSGGPVSEHSQEEQFFSFLTQTGLPIWSLYRDRGTQKSFYVPRDVDADLEKKVYSSLKKSGVNRRPILLSGPSNSGKSMVLANLALTIALRRKYPVIFIRGELLPGAEQRLDEFINHWFCNMNRSGGEAPDKTVVIWDGNGLNQTEKDYVALQKLLFARNVQVVGSLYSSKASDVHLNQDLSPREKKQLYDLLRSIGGSYADRLCLIQDQQSRQRESVLRNSSLLYLLQSLFKYEFDAEYRSLADILSSQFQGEKIHAEWTTAEDLQEYVSNFYRAQQTRATFGIASSFQEQCRLILSKMQERKVEEQAAPSDELSLRAQREKKLKQLQSCIAEINEVLALSSEFGVQLPLMYILHFLRDEDDTPYFFSGSDNAKILEVLENDTLLEFTYRNSENDGDETYIGYRNSIEAENCICLLSKLPLGDRSPARAEKEVEILKQIISRTDINSSNSEVRAVIQLTRQFGPNGHGKLSELERQQTRKDYLTYRDYWYEIAMALVENLGDDPEAVLVYAHLLREFIVQQPPQQQTWYHEDNTNCLTRLRYALGKLEQEGQRDTAQYDRLSVELCANLQQNLKLEWTEAAYLEIKQKVRNAFHNSKQRRGNNSSLRNDFSSNYLLDILLNAYDEFCKSALETNEERIDRERAEILCSIDEMLNLEDLAFEQDGTGLISKIRRIYNEISADGEDMLDKKLTGMDEEARLFLKARLIWQKETALDRSGYSQIIKLFAKDRYAILCRDIPYAKDIREKIPAALMTQLAEDAKQAVLFLEAEKQSAVIHRTKSERCIAMLMRAKWFLKTGNTMLEEKQRVSMTRKGWNELNYLCNCYHSYHNSGQMQRELFLPACFFSGVYEWIYGDPQKAREWFDQARSGMDQQTRSVERIVLCAEGSDTPRTFIVTVQQNDSGRYNAKILHETTGILPGTDQVANRYGLRVPPNVVKYLFDGSWPKEWKQDSVRPGEIRFNLAGAQIGIPQKEGR